MGEVVELQLVTRLDVPAERVLNGALGSGLEKVVVLGWDADVDSYFASSMADGAEVLWLMELAKKQLLEVGS